jgi:predicted transcriptional regulator
LTRPDVWHAVEGLRSVGLLRLEGEELLPTSLGEVVSGGTLRVSSAVGIVRLLRELEPDDVTGELLLVAAQCTTELDAVAVDGTVTWRELVTYFAGQGFPKSVTDAVVNAANHFDRAARALICLNWVRLVSMTEIEAMLAGRGATRIVPINLVLGRTRDVIDSVVRLALELHPSSNRPELVQLPVRLDHGVPAAFGELAVRAGRTVDRWDYRCLWRHGLRDVESVLEFDAAALAVALGDDLGKAATVRRLADDVVDSRQAYDGLLDDPV